MRWLPTLVKLVTIAAGSGHQKLSFILSGVIAADRHLLEARETFVQLGVTFIVNHIVTVSEHLGCQLSLDI